MHGAVLPAVVELSALSPHHRPAAPGDHPEGLAVVAPAPPRLLLAPKALTRGLSPHGGLRHCRRGWQPARSSLRPLHRRAVAPVPRCRWPSPPVRATVPAPSAIRPCAVG